MIHTETTDQLFRYLQESRCEWGVHELMRLVELAEKYRNRNVQLTLKRAVEVIKRDPIIYPVDSEGRPCESTGEVIDFA